MLEVKPLTTADHFVHATHPVAGARAVTPHVAAASVLVTISPQAAALSASRQREAVKNDHVKKKRANPYQDTEVEDDLNSGEAGDTKKALSDAEGS